MPSHCDFCDDPAEWCYDAEDVTIDLTDSPLLHQSVGGWAACTPCADLIDAEAHDDLVTRSYASWRAKGMPSGDVLHVLRMIHRAFWASKRGGRQPLPTQ
jgi:hypothetical protein